VVSSAEYLDQFLTLLPVQSLTCFEAPLYTPHNSVTHLPLLISHFKTMSSTVRQVLNTPELLESILLWVEPRTLLVRCNLVCQQWHDAISTSPSLQQTLFFAPRLDCTPHFNPILSQDFSIFFDGEYHSLRDFDSLRIRGKGQRSAFMRQEASWRRMLVKQPPIERIGVLFWTGRDLEASEVYGAIYSPLRKPKSTEGGITMSVLYDRIVNHPDQVPIMLGYRKCLRASTRCWVTTT